MNWPVLLGSFLASSVEFVEALTIVLAVGATRGFRPALTAALLAIVLLLIAVGALGAPLVSLFPIGAFKVLIGLLLLLFGARWLKKAILRSAGKKALHDEALAYEKTVGQINKEWGPAADRVAFLTAFNGVLLEGIEVVFVVLTLGASGGLASATTGAVAGLFVVGGAGFLLRAPLTKIPENALKFVVGLLLTTFGTFWLGEGIGITWPGADLFLLALLGLFGLAAYFLTARIKTGKEVSM